jgi:hypothetical protein
MARKICQIFVDGLCALPLRNRPLIGVTEWARADEARGLIYILTDAGPKGTAGWALGPFGVHEKHKDNGRRDQRRWVVTHLRTGLALASGDSLVAAKRLVETLIPLHDWNFSRLAGWASPKEQAALKDVIAQAGARRSPDGGE